jgi:hypothetical protein
MERERERRISNFGFFWRRSYDTLMIEDCILLLHIEQIINYGPEKEKYVGILYDSYNLLSPFISVQCFWFVKVIPFRVNI